MNSDHVKWSEFFCIYNIPILILNGNSSKIIIGFCVKRYYEQDSRRI